METIGQIRRRRPLDLLRMWHDKIEGWMLEQAGKLRVMLTLLDSAKRPEDMNAPGWKLHPLTALGGNCKRELALDIRLRWRQCRTG